MSALSTYPITQKWPAQHPERLQLYSLPTPNGVKASIMLEEIGLPYEAHVVSFDSADQLSSEFPLAQPQQQKSPPSSTPMVLAANHWRCSSQGPS